MTADYSAYLKTDASGTATEGLGRKVAVSLPSPQSTEFLARQPEPEWKGITPLSDDDRENLYERLRNNVPEPLQKEPRWILIRDTEGEGFKKPIGGHPSATMNLEQAINAHRRAKNNIDAIGYTTGGQMQYGERRTIPPDPNCIWMDYDGLKDKDGKVLASQEIIDEIEKLRMFRAYVEISGSRKGIHVCLPKPDYYDADCKQVVRHGAHQPEIFGGNQYVKVTGYLYGDALPDWQAFAESQEAASLVRSIITREHGFLTQVEKERGTSSRSNSSSGNDYEPLDMAPVSDEEWPDKFRARANADTNH